ncbi:MAG: hypothetical protein ACRCUM_02015 [Mycoplasmoidaceae bacterium]
MILIKIYSDYLDSLFDSHQHLFSLVNFLFWFLDIIIVSLAIYILLKVFSLIAKIFRRKTIPFKKLPIEDQRRIIAERNINKIINEIADNDFEDDEDKEKFIKMFFPEVIEIENQNKHNGNFYLKNLTDSSIYLIKDWNVLKKII